MTPHEAIAEVKQAFGDVARPESFIRNTCNCCECMEHGETLAAHTPETISLEQLGHPSWDPICFANDQAFAYYVPAMIRLAFGPDYYLDQLLFHLNLPDRVQVLTADQAKAVLDALWTLQEVKCAEIREFNDEHQMDGAMRLLEQVLSSARD